MYCNSVFCCPVCGEELKTEGRVYRCSNSHSFDCAKSGYVNLLTSDRMNTKNPGDNKLMVRARSLFLDKGYYSDLRKAICETVGSLGADEGVFLDAGCGEGYYTRGISEYLSAAGSKLKIAGIDISKFAADKAAKRNKDAEIAVASVFHIPMKDSSCDVLLNVFAPFCHEECLRVVKKGGYMILVIPDRLHLWELKAAVYETPYENVPKKEDIQDFQFEGKVSVKNRIFLDNSEDIRSLFAMTPYFYNTGAEDREKLSHIDSLETKTEFEILIYRRK